VMRLPNDGELTLTWARLVTPSGYYLQSHGVVPTLCTSAISDDDRSLDAALHNADTAAGGVSLDQPRASLSDQAWTILRQSCPSRTESSQLDIKIAERVLNDPARYGEAVGAIRTAPSPALHSGQASPAAALTALPRSLFSETRIP
jgi:carboxyl-terminal processing protease